jgi:hypothetical protein
MNREEKTVVVPGMGIISAEYEWAVGKYMDRYIKGLKEKKIFGVKCPSCKRVYVPPRSTCGRCFTEMDEWVEVSDEGSLENFTVGYVKIGEGGDLEDLKEPKIIGMIKFDGADTCIVGSIEETEPEEVKIGMKVKAVWREETRGELGDINYYKPIV